MDELKQWMQNAFNKAYLGWLKQGKPSMKDFGCAYITEEGCRCAVGFLLPENWDAELAEDLEGSSVHAFFGDEKFASTTLKQIGVPSFEQYRYSKTHRLLEALQHAHDKPAQDGYDGPEWVEMWRIKMVEIAAEYGLTVPDDPVPV